MAIARALINHPPVLFADEPTGNLDPLISWEILQLLLRINELGVTVIMATHDAEVVTALRKRVVALEDGRVVAEDGGRRRSHRRVCSMAAPAADTEMVGRSMLGKGSTGSRK